MMITMGLDGPNELADEAARADVPLLRTALPTPVAIARLTNFLEDRLAPRETRHGVLLDILGLGVLLAGESGIGKSECALDLVGRGHRLVADDTVEIRCRGQAVLIGTCPELTRHHVEIRGLGLVNVTDLFGVSATRSSKRVELVVQLERWERGREYDRLGLDTATIEILGVPVPLVTMPVAPGRNLAMLVEVAARNHLLRSRGRHAARLLAERLERRLERLADRPDDGEAEDL
jgi:HPr kinase/phosphorylase